MLNEHDVDPTKLAVGSRESKTGADSDSAEKLPASDAPTTEVNLRGPDGAILTFNVGPGAPPESRAEAVAMAEDAVTRLADTIVAEEKADQTEGKPKGRSDETDDKVFSAWAYRP